MAVATSQIVFEYFDPTGTHTTITPGIDGPGDPNWHGDIAMTVVRNLVDGTTDEPYLLLFVFQAGQTLYGGSLRLGAIPDSGTPAFNTGSLQIAAMAIDSDFYEATPAAVGVQRGPDGVAYVTFMDKRWRTLHYGSLAYVPGQPLQWAGVLPSAYDGIDRIPPTIYASGEFPDPSESGNPAKVPVYRTFLFDQKSAETVQIGWAQRTLSTQNAPDDPPGFLVGFVEGGPPVPNENIQAIDPKIVSSLATMTYGVETDADTDMTYNFAVDVMVKMSEEDGIPWVGTVDVDMDFDIGYSGKWTQQNQTKRQGSFTQDTGFEAGPEGNAVTCGGTAWVYIVDSYTAWQYDFLDASGNHPDPLADTYVQLVPNEPSLVPFSYAIDPASTEGPVPGNLLTYYMTTDQLQQLESSAAIPCSVSVVGTGASSESSFPETGWDSMGGKYTEEVAKLVKDSTSQGLSADASEMIGGTVMGTKVQVGLKTKFDFEVGWGTEQTSTYKSELDKSLITDGEPPPGQYSRYAFVTLMLAPNATYVDDLLRRLEYVDEAGLNADLKAHINPDSMPWKITYAVTSYHIVGEPLYEDEVGTDSVPAKAPT
jgi:hypothetical protein